VAGLVLTVIGVVFLAYTLAGPYAPGVFAHRGFSLVDVVDYQMFGLNGIFGIPLGVSVTCVVRFIILGTIMEESGTGAVRRAGDQIKVHLHGSLDWQAREVVGGAVLEGTRIFKVAELVIAGAKKRPWPRNGLNRRRPRRPAEDHTHRLPRPPCRRAHRPGPAPLRQAV
jgi:hypothetical protein